MAVTTSWQGATLGANTFTGSQTITGGTVTASAPVIDATQTWNNAAVAFTGLKLNVTATASDAASLLQDWQVGGVSIASIRKDGFLVTSGSVSVGASQIMRFNTQVVLKGIADGQMNINNFAQSAGVGLDVGTDGVLKVRNRALNADGAITASSGTFSTTLATAAPAGASAGLWKLGSLVTAAVVVDTTRSVFVDIGGTVYKLLVAQ